MSGPWERYAAPGGAETPGPWAKYAQRPTAAPAPAQPLAIDTAEGMPWYEKAAVGAGAALAKGAEGLAGLVGADKAAASMKADREAYERHKADLGGWGTTGEVVGDIAKYAPAALTGAGFLPAAMAAGGIGAATTPGGAAERGTAAAMDVAGAGAGHVLAKTLGRFASPIGQKTADVLALEGKGIEPTFGQAMTAKGGLSRSVGRAEEAMQSMPMGGGVLREAREVPVEQFQRFTREAALPPGASAGAAKSADTLRSAFGDTYKSALTSAPMPYEAVKWNPAEAVSKLAQGVPVTKAQRKAAEKFAAEVQLKHLKAGGSIPTAEVPHAIQSDIRSAAGKFSSSQDPAQRAYGELLADVADDFGKTWRGGLDPELQQIIGQIDRAYASYVPVRHAAKTNPVSKAPEDYTPNVFLRALRTTDRTPNKHVFIAGNRPGQDTAQAAERVLSPKMRDSGTAERQAHINPLTMALSLVPGAAVAGYASKPAQNYLMGRYGFQQPLAGMLEGFAPYARVGGAALSGE